MLIRTIRVDSQLLLGFHLPFMPLQATKRIFQPTKNSMAKEDAKKTVKMLRENTRRKARKRRRESTERRKEKRNYSLN